jgi:hypothetical protein
MRLATIVLVLAASAFPAAALAQHSDTSSTPRIDRRQAMQQQRIERGVQSGALTEKEAARLQKGQERIQKAEERALADDVVTKKERRKIERMQDRESRRIYREAHDRERAK